MAKIDVLLDLLFPPKCAFCGKLMEEMGSGVCPACEKALPFRENEAILQTVGENRYPCAVALYYDDMVRAGVKGLKFGKKSWRTRVFARYIAQAAAEELGGQFDVVTFVPVSRVRNFTRGFDQVELIARAVGKIWGVEAEPTLRKIRHNRAQSSLTDPAERAANVRGAYTVPKPGTVAGRRFLLLDDVVTTGSTIASCADTLMAAGAASVVCAGLAGGHKRENMGETPEDSRKIKK